MMASCRCLFIVYCAHETVMGCKAALWLLTLRVRSWLTSSQAWQLWVGVTKSSHVGASAVETFGISRCAGHCCGWSHCHLQHAGSWKSKQNIISGCSVEGQGRQRKGRQSNSHKQFGQDWAASQRHRERFGGSLRGSLGGACSASPKEMPGRWFGHHFRRNYHFRRPTVFHVQVALSSSSQRRLGCASHHRQGWNFAVVAAAQDVSTGAVGVLVARAGSAADLCGGCGGGESR